MNNKHAYLIIAHDNFQVLERLVQALDDRRHDIYIHIDKKVVELPLLSTTFSKLVFLDNRLDVRWGHVSQIECEYLLFEEAYLAEEEYVRYNLISGTHYPLKSNDDIYHFLESAGSNQLLVFMHTTDYEINFKLNYHHFFVLNFRSANKVLERVSQKMWHICVKLQQILSMKRNPLKVDIKASNWISVTDEAITYFLSQKRNVLSRFQYTFCGDEFFVPYLLRNSERFIIKDEQRLLFSDFGDGSNPRFLDINDFSYLENSDYLFARKFLDDKIEVINLLNKKLDC